MYVHSLADTCLEYMQMYVHTVTHVNKSEKHIDYVHISVFMPLRGQTHQMMQCIGRHTHQHTRALTHTPDTCQSKLLITFLKALPLSSGLCFRELGFSHHHSLIICVLHELIRLFIGFWAAQWAIAPFASRSLVQIQTSSRLMRPLEDCHCNILSNTSSVFSVMPSWAHQYSPDARKPWWKPAAVSGSLVSLLLTNSISPTTHRKYPIFSLSLTWHKENR